MSEQVASDPSSWLLSHTKRGHGGRREDLDLYVRSAWEANYARYLNWLIKQDVVTAWQYEPETFEFKAIKRGSRFYTPDFRVEFKDGSVEYHEVKGYLDQRGATKLKRMAKYFPEVKLVLIGRDYYKDLRRKVSALIEGWEETGV